MRKKLIGVVGAMLIIAVGIGVAATLLNGSDRPTPVSAAEACNLMITPYDAVLTGTTSLGVIRTEIRYSGGDRHMVETLTKHDGALFFKYEKTNKDRTLYSRVSTEGNPEVYGEWRVHYTDSSQVFALPCLDTSRFQEGDSGSSDEAHYAYESFLSDEEGSIRKEFWADSTGRPTRARSTQFLPNEEGTIVIDYTYSGYGEPNIIKAPCADAAPDQADNPALMGDCVRLLGLKDTLRGTAALNWGLDTPITTWTGVTVAGTPQRVTKLMLPNSSLNGSIPAWQMGKLLALTHLDLSGNSLTGEIPASLTYLDDLASIKLSGNSLTGCIPLALRSVSTNDFSSLSILYCPPQPADLTAGTPGETSVPLSWSAIPGVSKYRVWLSSDHSDHGSVWTFGDDSLTGTSHTADGLFCETEYLFRLDAYGDGTTNVAAWGDPSSVATATTGECVTPLFEGDAYAFSVREDAEVETEVGVVSATDPQDDAVTYLITAGNEDGKFAIHGSTGVITVEASLDHETTDEYALTVEADDGSGGTSAVTVTVTVTDVAEGPSFDEAGYSFDVAEDGALGDAVGTVSAMYQDEYDTLPPQ